MQRKEISSHTAELKEYMHDPKPAYTRSKLENDELIMFKGEIYIPIALRE